MTALKIMVIPGKATRTHLKGSIEGKAKGKVTVVNDDGVVIELDDASGTDGLNEGDEVVLITRRKGHDSDEVEIRGYRGLARVADRLEKIIQRIEDGEDSPRLDHVKKEIDKLVERVNKLLDRLQSSDSDDESEGDDDDHERKGKGRNGDDNPNRGCGRGHGNAVLVVPPDHLPFVYKV